MNTRRGKLVLERQRLLREYLEAESRLNKIDREIADLEPNWLLRSIRLSAMLTERWPEWKRRAMRFEQMRTGEQ